MGPREGFLAHWPQEERTRALMTVTHMQEEIDTPLQEGVL